MRGNIQNKNHSPPASRALNCGLSLNCNSREQQFGAHMNISQPTTAQPSPVAPDARLISPANPRAWAGIGLVKDPRLQEVIKYEYERANELTNFYLEYRTKVLSIFLALNGIGVSVVLTQSPTSTTKQLLSFFAFVVSLIGFLVQLRVNQLHNEYRAMKSELEPELGLIHLDSFHKKRVKEPSRKPVKEPFRLLRLTELFAALSALLVVMWIGVFFVPVELLKPQEKSAPQSAMQKNEKVGVKVGRANTTVAGTFQMFPGNSSGEVIILNTQTGQICRIATKEVTRNWKKLP